MQATEFHINHFSLTCVNSPPKYIVGIKAEAIFRLIQLILFTLTHIFAVCSAQMMEKLEDMLAAMEHNIAVRLDRIEIRLDSLEELVS